MRQSEAWLEQRLASTGRGYTENGRKVSPQPAAKKKDRTGGHYELSSTGVHKIEVKPLSVNEAWKGQRFKTDDYKTYEQLCAYLLPRSIEIPDGQLEIFFEWGFSSGASDYDNPIKPFQDILQKRFGFDDRRIVDAHISKRLVEQGK
jgi:Holliday junction resolvase RusA-like endonuclease